VTAPSVTGLKLWSLIGCSGGVGCGDGVDRPVRGKRVLSVAGDRSAARTVTRGTQPWLTGDCVVGVYEIMGNTSSLRGSVGGCDVWSSGRRVSVASGVRRGERTLWASVGEVDGSGSPEKAREKWMAKWREFRLINTFY